MNSLALNDSAPPPHGGALSAGMSSMSWLFWVKAGIGFTFGAGLMSIASNVLWVWVISKVPALFWMRVFFKF